MNCEKNHIFRILFTGVRIECPKSGSGALLQRLWGHIVACGVWAARLYAGHWQFPHLFHSPLHAGKPFIFDNLRYIYIQPVCADTFFVFYSGPVAVYTDVCEQPDISLFADSSFSDALGTAPVVTYAPCSVSTMLLDSATLGGPRDYERLRFFYFC